MTSWNFGAPEEDDEDFPFGAPSPHAPEGMELIGADTPPWA